MEEAIASIGGVVSELESIEFDAAVVRRLVIEMRDMAEGEAKHDLRSASNDMDGVVRHLKAAVSTLGGETFDGQYDIWFGDDSTQLDARDVNDLAWAWVDFCYDNGIDPFSVDGVERVGDYECDVPPEDGE